MALNSTVIQPQPTAGADCPNPWAARHENCCPQRYWRVDTPSLDRQYLAMPVDVRGTKGSGCDVKSSMRLLVTTLVVLLVGGSCAATEPVDSVAGSPSGSSAAECRSDDRLSDLAYGMPTFDYDRQETLSGLLDQAHEVLQGVVIAAGWADDQTFLTIADVSPIGASSIDPGSTLTVGYLSSTGGEPHPLATPVTFTEPVEVLVFLGEDSFQGHREVLLQGLLLRCDDETLWSVIEPVPQDVADMGFWELVDTTHAKVPPVPPRPAGPTRSIPYRLLVEDLAEGQPWSTAIVAPDTPGIDADWETEVVFEFNLAESGSCPFGQMEDLRFDQLNDTLFPVVPLADDFDACTDDANPHLIRVAVKRSDLPEDDFLLWVNEAEPPSGVVEGVTEVKVGELG